MLARIELQTTIQSALNLRCVVTLIGQRQCSKTTLARKFVSPNSTNYLNLEDHLSLARLDQSMTVKKDLRGLDVIRKVQCQPDLFPILRVLADCEPLPSRFLSPDSALPELLQAPCKP